MKDVVVQDGQRSPRAPKRCCASTPTRWCAALARNGLIVPVPQTVGLWGQGLIEGRALIDNVVAGDRTAVVRLWLAAQKDGAAQTKVRMLASPTKLVDAALHRPAGSARRLARCDPARATRTPTMRRASRRAAPAAASLLHAHRGRGRPSDRRRRRVHADVRLHRGGAARQVGARPDPPRGSGTCRRGLARSDLQQPRAADAPAPQAQGRQLRSGSTPRCTTT